MRGIDPNLRRPLLQPQIACLDRARCMGQGNTHTQRHASGHKIKQALHMHPIRRAQRFSKGHASRIRGLSLLIHLLHAERCHAIRRSLHILHTPSRGEEELLRFAACRQIEVPLRRLHPPMFRQLHPRHRTHHGGIRSLPPRIRERRQQVLFSSLILPRVIDETPRPILPQDR